MNSHLGQACDAKVSALIEKKKGSPDSRKGKSGVISKILKKLESQDYPPPFCLLGLKNWLLLPVKGPPCPQC